MTKKNSSPAAGKPVRSKTDPPASSLPGTGSIVAPFLFFSGLLWVAMIAYVICLWPTRTTDILGPGWVARHQTLKNFLLAERIVVKLLPSPPTRWSPITECKQMGRGVWYAEGMVWINSSGRAEIPVRWRAIFVPATSQPLYLAVGSQTEGDFAAAIKLTGFDPRSL